MLETLIRFEQMCFIIFQFHHSRFYSPHPFSWVSQEDCVANSRSQLSGGQASLPQNQQCFEFHIIWAKTP